MRKFLTIAIIALSINAFAQNSKETQVATKNLTIIGTIKNFEEFAAFIVLDTTNIQLVSVPADGRLGVTYTHQGRLSFNSNLPKLPVPKKAAFRYNM